MKVIYKYLKPYLPFLLLVALFSGALTGFVVALLFRAMELVNLSRS